MRRDSLRWHRAFIAGVRRSRAQCAVPPDVRPASQLKLPHYRFQHCQRSPSSAQLQVIMRWGQRTLQHAGHGNMSRLWPCGENRTVKTSTVRSSSGAENYRVVVRVCYR